MIINRVLIKLKEELLEAYGRFEDKIDSEETYLEKADILCARIKELENNKEAYKNIEKYLNISSIWSNHRAESGEELLSIIKTICTKNPAKEASQLLHRAGLVGIHYNGMRDGECYVIFDDKDLKITRHERFMKTNDGVVYGYVDSKGNVHLDRSLMNGNTPIHEFGHLWNDWCKENNAELWGRGVELIKDSRYYEEVKRESQNKDSAYFGMNEAQIVDEAMARAIGDKGEELLKQHDITKFAEFKSWLAELWHDLKKKFGVGYNENLEDMTLDEFTEIANRDLLGGEKLNNDSMTDEQRTIVEQAKENGTYMKAPNGKPTKLTEKQWVQVRTKAFKEWFGDWEKAARIEKLRKAEPIKITGKEHEGKYELNRDSAKTWIKANIKGEYINKDTNEKIVVSNVGVKEVTSHGERNEAHLKSLIAIPELISNSIFVEEIPNTKEHDKYDSYRYYVCGLNIGGVDYTAKVVIGVKGDSKYYDHRLTEIEKGTLINNLNGLSNTVAENQNTPNSVGKDKRLLSILQVNSSKVVDENGEPMVVYHGTDTNITTFDKEKTADSNFWFINRKDKIENGEVGAAANGKIIPVWLNARNLADWKEYDKYGLDELRQMKYDGIDLSEDEERTFVIFEPTQIKSATDNIGTYDNNNPDIRYQEQKDSSANDTARSHTFDKEVNEQFNRELAELTEENVQSKRLKLGYPSPMLSAAGVPDKSIILYGNKLLKKAKLHNFDVKDLHNLPLAMQNPIAVFEGSHPNSFATLLEIKLGGYNTLASIEVNKKGEADFNFISSLFGKESKGVTKWILDGKLLSVDKEKAQSYISASALNADATYKKELSSAAKIVKDFVNPNIGEEKLREGYGSYTNEELSFINDSWAKMIGKSNRAAFAERERSRMTHRIEELADTLHLDNVEVVTDASQLDGNRAKAKGFYSKRTGKITVVVPNHANIADIEKTILHEAVAHHGLRELFGEEFDNMIESIFMQVDAATRLEIMRKSSKRGWDYVTATEEYLASMAEDANFEHVKPSVWQRIKQFFGEMLSAVGLHYAELTDNDLRYILWRSYENLKKGGKRGIFDVAEDVAMQHRLKVGNYAAQEADVFMSDGADRSDQVNKVFNEQLGTLTEENADKVALNLGTPSAILRAAGVEDKPMKLYGSKLMKKAKLHGFSPKELQNLPAALTDPIAVFDNYKKTDNRSILTELNTKDGNILVSLTIGKGIDVDFNIIASAFGKANDSIVKWINKGFATYINKEKALNYLYLSAPIAEAAENSELNSAAKIVENFENPKQSNDVLYHNNIVGHVNEKFNEALQRQINGTLAKGYVYNLGMPSSILLSANIPNLPIQLNATRLKEKATSFGHDFDLSEIKNLVKSLQHPMAIFKYGDERKAQNIVIELQQGDKNFIVGLSLNPTINGRELHINSIRNVFPKDNAEWLNWISQGKLLRVNKEKVQNLINQQRTILADVDYLDLDSIAKIIKDFENRKLNDDVIYPIVENGSLQWVDKEKALNYLHHSALRAEALSSSRLNSAAKIIKDFENRKLNDDVIYPIVENGSLQWVDKEKGLNWLSSVSHYAQQEIDNQALNSAAKIVENFENRKLNDDVIYRDNDSAENTDARSIYEQRVRRSMFQTQEALQDSMLGLKEAMEAITKSEGKKIERVLSLETKGLFLFYHFYFTCISNV